ncbi:uncharacterized protein LOC130902627 [Diorhabda carinulata]|uniref:uncharacterized protein LOC130902627 n=1 Tax=Diorhabda carinulata TaxID=1163345 RepID=UPI0025A260C8|nr:uncharacterized protein LOC130902627 [Diorhabda carinulata]
MFRVTDIKMLVLLIPIWILILDTQIAAGKIIERNNLRCENDNVEKFSSIFHVGKELICHDLTITKYDVIERKSWKKEDDKYVVQFASVNGSFHRKLINNYPSVNTIFVYNSTIRDFSLPFRKCGILLIIESNLPIITSDFFVEASGLRHLGFYSNPDVEFEEGCFSDLRHLRNLTIFNESFPILKNNFLEGLVKLKRLAIVNSQLEKIDNDAFIYNNDLHEIILDGNPMEEFVANLSILHHLRTVSLLNTKLKKLDLPIFFPVYHLHTLGLPNSVWSGISVVRLAEAFPRLRTAVFNEEEKGNDVLDTLMDDFESSGLQIRKVKHPKEINTFMYDIAS